MALSIMVDLIRTISVSRWKDPQVGGHQKPRIIRRHHKIETRRWYFFLYYLPEASSPPVIGGDHRGGIKNLNTSFNLSIIRRNKTVNLFPHV